MFHAVCVLKALCVVAASAGAQVMTETYKIVPSDGDAGAEFGWQIGISDGVILVNAINQNPVGKPYRFDAATGAPLDAVPTPTDPGLGSFANGGVITGERIGVSGFTSNGAGGSGSGAVYLYDALTLAPSQILLPDAGVSASQFGQLAIGIDGGSVAVGSPAEATGGENLAGAAYLFDALTGAPTHKLLPPTPNNSGQFGRRVAIRDGITAISESGDDTGIPDVRGSVHLFDVSTGSLLHSLTSQNGPAQAIGLHSVALDGGIVAATSDRGVLLFDAASGVQTHLIQPEDQFAVQPPSSAALGGGFVVVGAESASGAVLVSGMVYLYDVQTGDLLLEMQASDAELFDKFGSSVAIEYPYIVVAAIDDQDNGEDSGSVYVFDLTPCNAADMALPPGQLTTDDIDEFIAAFLSGDPIADLNGNGSLNVDDIDAFVAAFLAGCP